MKKGKLLAVLLTAACLLSALSGCGSSGSSSTASANVVLAFDTDILSMDTKVATDGTSFSAQDMVISGLTKLSADGVVEAELAKSWDISDDGMTYTFHLEDAKWSNGTKVTANDFVFGWRHLVDPALASEYSFIMDTIHVKNAADVTSGALPLTDLGVEATDDTTFVVHLTQPCDFLLSLMAFPSFFPVNEAFYTEKGDQFALTAENVLACGPYTMTTWSAGNEYVFTKNPDYFKADEIKAETVTFKYIQDTQSALLSYENGDVDFVKLSGELVDSYKGKDGYTNRLAGYMWYLSINYTNSKFVQGGNLAKAMALAIDRDTLCNDVLKDGSVAAQGIIPVKLATGPDGKDYRETAGTVSTFDATKAAEYYAAAVKENGGQNYSIELLYEDSDVSKKVAEQLQNMLQTNCPGLTVTLNSKPKKSRLDLMHHQEYEVALTRWGPDYADPETYMDLFLSSNWSNNNGRYNSTAYDALVNGGDANANSEERWQQYIDAEKILIDDAAVIPVYQTGDALMINPKVTGIRFHAAGVDCYRYMVSTK